MTTTPVTSSRTSKTRNAAEAATEPAGTSVTTGTAGLAHTDAGPGRPDQPALLLLPGWCGDRTVFDRVWPILAEHRRVVVVDLPEHGENPRTGGDVTSSDVVDAVLALLEQLGVERVIPVALSHAGWVALELRRRLGAQRVPGLVLLDWMVLGTPPGFGDALAGLQDEKSWAGVRDALFAMWTDGVDEPAVRGYVASMADYGVTHWHRAGREIASAFAAEPSPLAALARLDPPCPTLHLYAQPADEAVLDAQRDWADRHPWFEVHRLPAASHFPMLEVPTEMASLISQFTSRVTR